MTRSRTFIEFTRLLGTCALFLTGISAHAAEADQFADVKVSARHVAGSVHMLTGAGGNIGVSVGEDGTLIIDDQFAPLAGRIQPAIDGLGKAAVRAHPMAAFVGRGRVDDTSDVPRRTHDKTLGARQHLGGCISATNGHDVVFA